jgi:hypothetical protein
MLVVLVSWVLTACGGGGGSTGGLGGGAGDSGAASDAEPTLVLTLVDSSGDPVTEVNGTDSAIATAVLRDSEGDVVSGNLVAFSVSAVGVLEGNSSAVTDTLGVATLTLTAGTTSGAGSLSASASITEDGEIVNVASNALAFSTDGQGTTTDPVNLTVVLTLTPMTLTRSSPGTITLTLTDDAGDPIEDAIVTFTSSVTASGGELGTAALFTDASGIATTSLTAGTSQGSATLDASVVFGNENVSADTVNFITAGDAVATLTLASSATAAISAAAPSTITATLTGADGVLAQNIPVDFSLSGTVGSLNATEDATNASGEASVVLAAGTGAGFGEVTATATLGTTALVSDPVAFESLGDDPFTGQGSSSLNISLALIDTAGNPIDPPDIDADTPGILQATVTDTLGGVEDIIVFFEASPGDLFPLSGLKLTDANGIATASLTAGSTPGAGDASATIQIDGQSFDADTLTFSTLGNAGDTIIAVTLNFNDATPGNNSNIITNSEPGTLSITVEDDSGTNLPNRTASITTTLGVLALTTCPALEADGVDTLTAVSQADGTISLQVCGYSTIGTGDIAVTVGDTTETVQFDVGVDGLQIGELDRTTTPDTFTVDQLTVSVDPLSAGGVSKVTVTVVDQAENTIPNIDINFTSNCAETIDADSGEAEALVSATITSDANGDAEATYQANGCVGTDVITATETSSGATATGTIDVLPAQIGSIKFDSVVVDPDDLTLTSIQIKESGGIDRGNVIFQVLDVFGDPAPDQDVQFVLTSNVGGLALVNSDGLTDSEGKVSATVAAGFIPTTVRVSASLEVDTDDDGLTDTTLKTLSELLTVNTGIPDQNSMSISATVQNIEGNGLDGLTTSITVRMSDAFENPVTDGTAVTFRTELGSIEPQCTTTGGACAVTLTTQSPRTPLDPNVSFKTLFDGCPTEKLTDENVTIAALAGETNYMMDISATVVVQTAADAFLTEGVAADYRVDTDGGGITCVAASATCINGATLKVTYDRLWLDEDPFDVVDEAIVIAGATGTTASNLDTDVTVEVADTSGTALVEGVDYTVAAAGITCIGTSTECVDTAALTISYDLSTAGKTHSISNPGVATQPFSNVTGVPCRASARAATTAASAYNFGLGQPYGARSTILAYALGEESFIDTNGNGQYDFAEPFVDLHEAFLDKNEDGVFDNGDPTVDDSRNLANPNCYGPSAPITNPAETLNVCYQDGGEEETFIDFGDAVTLNDQFDGGNLIYNGTLCPKAISDRAGPCADPLACLVTERYCTRDLVNIRREIDILLSGSTAFMGRRDGSGGELVSFYDITGTLGSNQYTTGSSVTSNTGAAIAGGTAFTIGDSNSATEVSAGIGETVTLTSGSSFIVFDIADIYNGFLPATTTWSAASGTDGCVIQNTASGVIGNTGALGFTQIGLSVAPPTSPLTGGAPITMTVTTADGGVLSQAAVSCVY